MSNNHNEDGTVRLNCWTCRQNSAETCPMTAVGDICAPELEKQVSDWAAVQEWREHAECSWKMPPRTADNCPGWEPEGGES